MTMRLRHSAALARMLLVFFRRRVLRMGVLRSASVRIFAVSVAVLLLGVMCASAYFFLEPLAADMAVWRLLFDTATVSLVLWVQIAFLLVKVLFINAEGMLALSYQLPLTNRERSAAFLMYEASMTGVVAGAGFISLAVSALLLLGPAAAPHLAASVILPVVLTYLALSVLYQVLTRLWALIGLRRIANVLSVLALFALLALYSGQMKALILDISQAYLHEQSRYVWVTSVSWAWHRYGAYPAFAAAVLLAAALMALTLALTPNQHVRQSRYLNIPAGRRLTRVLGPYDWCLLRNSQTAVGASMAVALFVYLALHPVMNPMWSFTVLSLGGLYQFTATQPLRMISSASASPWRIYGRLVKAQVVLLAVFAVPGLGILGALAPHAFAQSGPALLGCLGAAVMTTCISIVFPAEKDNPFSVFLGLSVVGVILALSAIGLGMLSLPPWAVTGCLAGASVLFAWYAVQGIRTSESRRRNEKGTIGCDVRRRVRSADSSDRGGDASVPHVLNGRRQASLPGRAIRVALPQDAGNERGSDWRHHGRSEPRAVDHHVRCVRRSPDDNPDDLPGVEAAP
ncbi:hypothetical protein JOF56_010132 [Kibdelosporangium banguiense]|uniref:ABC-2 type transport system permease protein n=1 Tax=Kibdelosporangium banguiense TaxID=1365924 RepID=A0ABS4TZA9_9PSEU|nr:hypothetical protein [Kibdelosporangium banguiense]MBP2329747.1 hypothetical protein [Kibdelosporangium banguiense]